MSAAEVVAVSAEQASRDAISDGEHPEAVVLDLEQPIIAIEGRWDALYDLE
jgi:hypothetical protein